MIAVDTNVLVRYLYRQDDAAQSALAIDLIDRAAERGESVYLSGIVLCEVVWILRGSLRIGSADVLAMLHQLLARTKNADSISGVFVIENEALVRTVVDDYASSRADFADHLIGHLVQAAEAVTTYTFDRRASASPYFKLLERV